ncbi:hypothetical protein [Lysinibacillus sp. RC79]|uniref:hypothetical protein n=1 Tax=Lysinibacillus sp. RC79 TaxID=3156296 RepID=UPI003518FAC7
MEVQALRRLIQEVVSTIVNTKKKRVLIVHPHTAISNKQVETLKNYFQVVEWQTEAFATNSSQMVYDAKVFLEVDQTFIVSSAQGLPNSPASLFLTELLLKDEPALLVPDEKMSLMLTTKEPNAYMKMLRQHMESLKNYGCEFQLFSQLMPYLNDRDSSDFDMKEGFITEEMIRSYQGQQLKIPMHSKLTPLAQDVIQEKGIIIQRK